MEPTRKRIFYYFRSVKVVAAALVVAGAATGCGSDVGSFATMPDLTPAGYSVEDGSTGGGGGDPSDPIPVVGSEPAVSSQITIAAGGQIVCGRHTLTIPPGAVKKDVTVTLLDLTDSQGHPCAQIFPEGLNFKQKATLVTRVSDFLDPATALMCWVNMVPISRATWCPVGGFATSDTNLQATIGKTGIYAVRSAH